MGVAKKRDRDAFEPSPHFRHWRPNLDQCGGVEGCLDGKHHPGLGIREGPEALGVISSDASR